MSGGLGWLAIVRLGFVQTALGSIVVLSTSTINRVMVVELALPALVPGILVGLHYAVQVLRPRLGYGSDVGGRRAPWIVGGMAVLALGGVGAALGTAWAASDRFAGLTLAVASFVLIGIGVGAAGTSLLALLAKQVAPSRRAAAATIVWLMMIAGFIVTAIAAGRLLDPFSPARLVAVSAGVSAIAFVVALLAVAGVEDRTATVADVTSPSAAPGKPAFRTAIAQIWSEPDARQFTIFVFVSMLAYSAQDLILEPFAGAVFGFTPGESTQLSGIQHGGVFAGMALVAVLGSIAGGRWFGSLRGWTVGGCIASAAALMSLTFAAYAGPSWPLRTCVFALGAANGAFAVAAIGSMMALAGDGRKAREGTRVGLWGAAQAIAFGLGGVVGTGAVDVFRQLLDVPAHAYALVFACDAALFVAAAILATRVARRRTPSVLSAPTLARGESPA
jgi:BCD family chlorophyll transporter-like MFS transporter